MTKHQQETLKEMKEQLHSWFVFNCDRVGAPEDAGPTATIEFQLSVGGSDEEGEPLLSVGRKETFDDPLAIP